jgi:hypothetical protein
MANPFAARELVFTPSQSSYASDALEHLEGGAK